MTEYCRLLRMDEDCFNFLPEALRPDITYQDTNCRKTVTPEQRLSTFLHFVATGKLKKNTNRNRVRVTRSDAKKQNSPNICFLAFLYEDECIKIKSNHVCAPWCVKKNYIFLFN